MLLNGELSDELFNKLVLGEIEEKAGKFRPAFFLVIAASFICALFASYVIYNTYIKAESPIPFIDKDAVKRKMEAAEIEKRTGGDPFLKEGYQKLGVIEETETSKAAPFYIESENKEVEDVSDRPELYIKPIELKGEPLRKRRDQSNIISPVFTGNYAIVFRKLNTNQSAMIKKTALDNDLKYKVVGSSKKAVVKWKVYKENKNSGTVIGGKNVSYLKTFKNRSSAVKYLQKKKVRGVVASDTSYIDYFDMQICCLGEEAAEKLARGSGISMRKIKILKK
jgi:hypothetical protein